MIDTGTAIAGITVGHTLRRNRKITITTSPIVSISVNCTSATEARMVVVRSEITETLMAGGMDASSCGSAVLHGLHRVDHVGAGKPLDRQDDASMQIDPALQRDVLRSDGWPCRHPIP